MNAIDEVRRMAQQGVTMDVMTMVLRLNFSDEEIAAGYDNLTRNEGWTLEYNRLPYFNK